MQVIANNAQYTGYFSKHNEHTIVDERILESKSEY